MAAAGGLRARFAAGLSAGKGLRQHTARSRQLAADNDSLNGDAPASSNGGDFVSAGSGSPPQNNGDDKADGSANQEIPTLERRTGSHGRINRLAVPDGAREESEEEEVEDTGMHSIGDASSVKQILERRYAALKKGRTAGHARTPSRLKRQELLRQTSIMRRGGLTRAGSNSHTDENNLAHPMGGRSLGLPPPSLKDMDDSAGSEDYSDREWDATGTRERSGSRSKGSHSAVSGEEEDATRDEVDERLGLENRERRADSQRRKGTTPRSQQRPSSRTVERLQDDVLKLNSTVRSLEIQQDKFSRETRKLIDTLAKNCSELQRQNGQLKGNLNDVQKKMTQVERKWKNDMDTLTKKLRDRTDDNSKHEKTPGQDLKGMLLQYFITGVSTIIAIVMAPFSAVYDMVTDVFQTKRSASVAELDGSVAEEYDDYVDDLYDDDTSGTRNHRRPPRATNTPRLGPGSARRDKTRDREREREREREWDAESAQLDSGTAANGGTLLSTVGERRGDREREESGTSRDSKVMARDWMIDDYN